MDDPQQEQFARCNIYNLKLDPDRAHDGDGLINFKRIANSSSLSSQCNFIDFASMPPGTTIGDHTHSASEEEFYLILRGEGHMRCGDAEFDVGPGDLVRNPPGGTHGLINTGENNLEMFVFEVKVA